MSLRRSRVDAGEMVEARSTMSLVGEEPRRRFLCPMAFAREQEGELKRKLRKREKEVGQDGEEEWLGLERQRGNKKGEGERHTRSASLMERSSNGWEALAHGRGR